MVDIEKYIGYGTSRIALSRYALSVDKHIRAVKKVGKVIGVDVELLDNHDASKYTVQEFPYYAQKSFGTIGYETDYNFAKAWNHHENNNPHHPSHWICRTGQFAGKPMPMTDKYILEMVADWHGASRCYQYTWDISNWFNTTFYDMKLHPETSSKVIDIISDLGYLVLAEYKIVLVTPFLDERVKLCSY